MNLITYPNRLSICSDVFSQPTRLMVRFCLSDKVFGTDCSTSMDKNNERTISRISLHCSILGWGVRDVPWLLVG